MARKRAFTDLAAYLAESGETQERVAGAVGATQAAIARIASGARMPRPTLAAKLARHCNIPIESFTRVYLARRAGSADKHAAAR